MSESGHINNPNVYISNSDSNVFMPQSNRISEMISVFDNPGKYIFFQLSTVMNIVNSYCFF